MNVFDHIPENFFNLLASGSDNRINAGCLLKIYELFDPEMSYKIDRESVRDAIATYFYDEHIIDPNDSNVSAGAKAGDIIEKFVGAGWLVEGINDETYNKTLAMTDLAVKLAEFLLEQSEPQNKEEYAAYIFNVYNCLMNEDQWADNVYASVWKVVNRDITSLERSLKRLSTSVESIVKQIAEKSTLESLSDHIVSYCNGDFITNYARLIRDRKRNIHFYRIDILDKLSSIYDDMDMYNRLVADCEKEDDLSQEFAAARVDAMFRHMVDFLKYDYDRLLTDIRMSMSDYFVIALSRLRFLKGHGFDTKVDADIRDVIECMVNISNNNMDSDDLAYGNLFNLYFHDFIDSSSITPPSCRHEIKTSTVIANVDISDDAIKKANQARDKAMNNPFRHEEIKRKVSRMFNNRSKISVTDFPIENKDDFLFALAAVTYSRVSDLNIEIQDGYTETDDFIIRNFTISKKE